MEGRGHRADLEVFLFQSIRTDVCWLHFCLYTHDNTHQHDEHACEPWTRVQLMSFTMQQRINSINTQSADGEDDNSTNAESSAEAFSAAVLVAEGLWWMGRPCPPHADMRSAWFEHLRRKDADSGHEFTGHQWKSGPFRGRGRKSYHRSGSLCSPGAVWRFLFSTSQPPSSWTPGPSSLSKNQRWHIMNQTGLLKMELLPFRFSHCLMWLWPVWSYRLPHSSHKRKRLPYRTFHKCSYDLNNRLQVQTEALM